MGYSKPGTQPSKKKPFNKKKPVNKKWRLSKPWTIALVVVIALLAIVASLCGYSYYQSTSTASAAAESQKKMLSKAPFTEVAQSLDDSIKYQYGNSNTGIPGANQLKEYQQLTTPMTGWGYAAAPKQDGLPEPITALPIYEGASDQTLAWGFGTIEPGYKMGKHNNLLAIHNFADGVTYGSPLQDIDVSKSPKFYQTDGRKIYEYQLTKYDNEVQATSKEYTDAVAQTVNDTVTLVTCYLPGYIYTPDHNRRVVVTGERVKTMEFARASSDIQQLFPMFVK